MCDRFVVYDEGDGSFLTPEYLKKDSDRELWEPNPRRALHFDTYAEATAALELCDEDEILRHRLTVVASNLLDEDLER